jgi:hypothetical protein
MNDGMSMRPQKVHPCAKPRQLGYNMWGLTAWSGQCVSSRNHMEKRQKARQVTTSPAWGATGPERQIVNISLSRDLGDIIIVHILVLISPLVCVV